jgi:Glycosyl transferase family 2
MSTAPRQNPAARIRDAVRRRLQGPYAAIGRVEERLEEIGDRIERLETTLGDEVRRAFAAIAADEAENRQRLAALRAEATYEAPWNESRPLISVTVATLGRPELFSRSLPSLLGQTYGELEVIVVGDGAGPEIGEGVLALGDDRVRYRHLGPRQPWTDDPGRLWLAGATRARNAAVGEARGHWLVEFDDDDTMRPQCLESLLGLARETRAEAVYGRIRFHGQGAERDVGEFPPRHAQFSWAAAMYHSGLRFFGRQVQAADLGIPGDWWLAERMLRTGVRFAMRGEVLCDVFESPRKAEALEAGGLPWDRRG